MTAAPATKVAHFGTFDVENYGDLLFPLILERRLAGLGLEFVHASPAGGPPVWGDCVSTVPAQSVLDRPEGLAAVVVGGGNIITPTASTLGAYGRGILSAVTAYPSLWLVPAFLAAREQIPFCWNGPGVSQTFPPLVAPLLKWAASIADYLSVRDPASEGRLREAGVTELVDVVPDTAIEVSHLWTDEELDAAWVTAFADRGLEPPQRALAFHLSARFAGQDPDVLAARLDGVCQRAGATAILLALGPCHGDHELQRHVGRRMSSKPLVIDRPQSLREVAACLARSEAYVGSSLHGLITACSFGRRAMAVIPEAAKTIHKFNGFLERFHLGRWTCPSWDDAEDRVTDLLASPGSSWDRVPGLAAPLLDAHWARVRALITRAERPAAPEPNRSAFPGLAELSGGADAVPTLYWRVMCEQARQATEAGKEAAAHRRRVAELTRLLGQSEEKAGRDLAASAATTSRLEQELRGEMADLQRRAEQAEQACAAEAAAKREQASLRDQLDQYREELARVREGLSAQLESLSKALADQRADLAAFTRQAAEREQASHRAGPDTVSAGDGPASRAASTRQGVASDKHSRYCKLVQNVRRLVNAALPPDAAVLVVSKGDDALLNLDGRKAMHFPQADDGLYAGHHPADSDAAIRHLEELRAKGAGFILFPGTAFWWLESYVGFGQHLADRYRRVLDRDGVCIVFDLQQKPGAAAGRVPTAWEEADARSAGRGSSGHAVTRLLRLVDEFSAAVAEGDAKIGELRSELTRSSDRAGQDAARPAAAAADPLATEEAALHAVLIQLCDQVLQREDTVRAAAATLRSVAESGGLTAAAATAATSAPGADADSYGQLLSHLRDAVDDAVPPDASVLVVNKGDDALLDLRGRGAGHFPQGEGGVYAGHYPADSDDAIRHLESLRRRGGQFLVFPATAFWWFDHYRGFRQHLDASFRRVLEGPWCVVYDLRSPAPPPTLSNSGTSAAAPPRRKKIAVLAWDVGHNPMGRAYLLAEMLSRRYDVTVVGARFPQYGSAVWEPVRGGPIPVKDFPGSQFPDHFMAMGWAVERIEADAVVVSKPRLPSYELGMLLKLRDRCPLVLDVDDYELSFFPDRGPATLEQVKAGPRDRDFFTPYGQTWTRYCDGIIPAADAVTTSNPALHARYGGLVVHHARDERQFDPGLYDRRAERARYGYGPDDKVILFVGTPRLHKGLGDTIAALTELKDPRCKLCVIGSFPDPQVRAEVVAAAGESLGRIQFVPNAPFSRLPNNLCVGDLICLVQDPRHPVTQYQMPAKFTDGLSMAVPILATDVPPLREAIRAGLAEPVGDAPLAESIRRIFTNYDHYKAKAVANREVFLSEYSYDANGRRLTHLIDSLPGGTAPAEFEALVGFHRSEFSSVTARDVVAAGARVEVT